MGFKQRLSKDHDIKLHYWKIDIRIKNPLHKQSEKVWMCFNTRRARTNNYTIQEKCPTFNSRSIQQSV